MPHLLGEGNGWFRAQLLNGIGCEVARRIPGRSPSVAARRVQTPTGVLRRWEAAPRGPRGRTVISGSIRAPFREGDGGLGSEGRAARRPCHPGGLTRPRPAWTRAWSLKDRSYVVRALCSPVSLVVKSMKAQFLETPLEIPSSPAQPECSRLRPCNAFPLPRSFSFALSSLCSRFSIRKAESTCRRRVFRMRGAAFNSKNRSVTRQNPLSVWCERCLTYETRWRKEFCRQS